MSPRKPTKILSETAKKQLIDEYKNTTISQRDVADKFGVSKTQVQKIFDQNNVVKLVRPVKKRKQKDDDAHDSSTNDSPNAIKEFSSMGEMARFVDDSPEPNVQRELFPEFLHQQDNADDESDLGITDDQANDRTNATENDEDVKLVPTTFDDNSQFAENQPLFNDIDEDDKFERYVKWYVGYKQEELVLIRQRQDRAEHQLGLEKEFHKVTADKLKESQLKVESLEEENSSLKSQLAVAEEKNNSCLQCDSKFTIKYRKLKFCGTACLQKMIAEFKSAGLN